MKEFKVAHPQDNPIEDGRTEVIGSTSLKDILLERGTIRGSWFLNKYEFRNFEAQNPAQAVVFVNEATPKTGVTATIDDGYHLVLTSSSPIAIASGYKLDRERQRQSIMARNRAQGHAERPVKDEDLDPRGDILELLGLTHTGEIEDARGLEWAPGAPLDEKTDKPNAEVAKPYAPQPQPVQPRPIV